MNKMDHGRLGLCALLVILLAGAGASLYVGVTAAMSDALSLHARWQLAGWQSSRTKSPDTDELGTARNDLMAALHWVPGDPQNYESLGYIYGVRALRAQAIPELEQALLNDAISYYRTAISLRPMSTFAWANLALALHLKGGEQNAMWSAYDRAYLYGNREAGVQRILAELCFIQWREAGADRQQQMIGLINSAYPHVKGDLVKIAQKYDKEGLLTK